MKVLMALTIACVGAFAPVVHRTGVVVRTPSHRVPPAFIFGGNDDDKPKITRENEADE